MRRVVVTGLGMVTPLASGVDETWTRLLAGESGAGPITRFDAKDVVTKYACEIPFGDGSDGTFNPDDWMEPKDRRKVDDFILYGMAAATQAMAPRLLLHACALAFAHPMGGQPCCFTLPAEFGQKVL